MTNASAPGPVQGKREDMRCLVPYNDRCAVGRGNCQCMGSQLDPGPCLSSFVSPNKIALGEALSATRFACQDAQSLETCAAISQHGVILWRLLKYLCYRGSAKFTSRSSIYQHYLLRETTARFAKKQTSQPTIQLRPICALTPTSTKPTIFFEIPRSSLQASSSLART